MSADILRRAAALMRERAEGESERAAQCTTCKGWSPVSGVRRRETVGMVCQDCGTDYAASWHPAVALAVADWLDLVARLLDEGFNPNAETKAALAVARVYLGEAS